MNNWNKPLFLALGNQSLIRKKKTNDDFECLNFPSNLFGNKIAYYSINDISYDIFVMLTCNYITTKTGHHYEIIARLLDCSNLWNKAQF